MLKRLTDEKIEEILEAGISEFATNGLHRTSMNSVAKRAGISVGVLYKYYADKDDFFLACLRRSLSVLERLLESLADSEADVLSYAGSLIDAVFKFSKENGDYIRMYHEITTGTDRELAKTLVDQIEKVTATQYTEIVRRAQLRGDLRGDVDPALMAFFFDSVMMMMQFSCSCPYYQERYKAYRGKDIGEEQDIIKSQLLAILKKSLT